MKIRVGIAGLMFTALISCALFSGAVVASIAEDESVKQLVLNADRWLVARKPEFVQQTLQKLRRIAPEHLDTIAFEAVWAVEQGQLDEARRHYFRLQHADSQHPALPSIAMLMRLASDDKPRLTQALLLARGGQSEKAIKLFDELFNGQPPSVALALLYYPTLAKTEQGWEPADRGLRALAQKYPESASIKLALLQHWVDKPLVTESVLAQLAELANDPAIAAEVKPVWFAALKSIDSNQLKKQHLQSYLAIFPEDNLVQSLVVDLQKKIDFERKYRAHPAFKARQKGLRQLQSNNNDEARINLLKAEQKFPNDIDVISGLGYAHLRLGLHTDAIRYFKKAMSLEPDNQAQWLSLMDTASYWSLHQQIKAAIEENQYHRAENLISKAKNYPQESQYTALVTAQLASRRGLVRQAEKIYLQLLDEYPNLESAHEGLLQLYAETGQHHAFERQVETLPPMLQMTLSGTIRSFRADYQFALAKDAFSKQQKHKARDYWHLAITSEPDNQAFYTWAETSLLENQPSLIFEMYRRITQQRPQVVFAQLQVMQRLFEQQKFNQLESHIRQLPAPVLVSLKDEIQQYRSQHYAYQAREALKNGRVDTAIQRYQQARALTPLDPWLLSDLAQLRLAHRQQLQADQDFARLYHQLPQDPDVAFAYSLYLAQINQPRRAAEVLQLLPDDQRSEAMQQNLRRYQQTLLTLELNNQPDKAQQRAMLQQHYQGAEQVADRLATAQLMVQFGFFDSALVIYQQQSSTYYQQNVEHRANYIDSLQQASQDQQAADMLRHYPNVNQLSVADFNRWQNLINQQLKLKYSSDLARWALSITRARVQKTELSEVTALAYLELLALSWPDEKSLDLQMQIARSFPRNAAIQIKLAGTLQAYGNPMQKEQQMQRLQQLEVIGSEERVQWLIVMQNAAQYAQAIEQGERWLTQSPDDVQLLIQLANAYRATGSRKALAYSRRAIAVERNNIREQLATEGREQTDMSAPSDIADYENLLNLEDRDNWLVRNLQGDFLAISDQFNGHLVLALDKTQQSGSRGKSEMNGYTLPLELKLPFFNEGHWFARVEPVYLDAGVIDTGSRQDSDNFADLLLCAPFCESKNIEQKQHGYSLALGIERENWKADIGTTPLGFSVIDLVGGFTYTGDWDSLYWSMEIARRPINSTLLSYAGAYAPYLQKTWGGARSNGFNVGLGYDQGEFIGIWSSFGYHWIDGEGLADNSRLRAMGGVYFRWLTEDPFRFTAGVNLLSWKFANDYGEFSYGQGGYYSPQTYASLSIPLELAGQFDDVSYSIKMTPSISIASDKDASYYPADAELDQLAKDRIGLTQVDPIYPGGSGSGTSLSFAAALEYKINHHWNIGFSLGLQRVEFYQPINGMIYFKYFFEDNYHTVPAPPKPPIIYAQF